MRISMTDGHTSMRRVATCLLFALAAAVHAEPGRPVDPCPVPSVPVSAVSVLEHGACLVSAQRFEEARAWFGAYPAARADALWGRAIANELGRVEAGLGNPTEARARFSEARLAPDAGVAVAAALNLAKIAPLEERITILEEAAQRLSEVERVRRPRLLLALAEQAMTLGESAQALALRALEEANQIARDTGQEAAQVQALDGLAQFYEDAGRNDEAQALTDAAVLIAGRLGDQHLLMPLAWRQARLLRAAGDQRGALLAFQRAADHLEHIRKDIPVAYADGRSSFRTTFAPVYQALAEMLLAQAPDDQQQVRLRRARQAVERIKQSELEDYLGERCVVRTGFDELAGTLAAGTAVLYPIILSDRLELLVERASGIERLSVEVSSELLTEVARRFARDLRTRGWPDTDAAILHRWLLAPVEALTGDTLDTLIVVPDASLRLFPFGSLRRDGRYVMEDYAIAVVPGLSITRVSTTPAKRPRTLLAGLSQPGEVVSRLPSEILRSLEGPPATNPPSSAERSARLQEILALPGVEQEIESLSRLGPGQVMLNEAFTVNAFERALGSGEFGRVHIASHGVFGDSAQSTFLMAHNDIISMDRLEQLLGQAGVGEGIDLLTLSACQTAEGDDRAPLGLAGAALKARAGAALGSLWPVADDATRLLMDSFYRALQGGASKVEALRSAQLEVLADPRFAHPFYWAPFILVGDWH